MAAATKKQDTRKPNLHKSGLPETIALAIIVAGTKLGELLIPQGDKLSEKGNVTFSGGIRKGWKLAGDPLQVLASIGFTVNGDTMKASGQGVHASEKGNPTVCHTAVTALAVKGGEPISYMVQVYPTFSVSKGSYNLSVRAFPVALGVAGPQVVGEIVGDGIVLEG